MVVARSYLPAVFLIIVARYVPRRRELLRRGAALLALLVIGVSTPSAQRAALPARPNSVKFAVIGDSGTGDRPQFDIAQQMTAARARFPFELVIMLGDNMYGRQQPQDFVDKFERPYAGAPPGRRLLLRVARQS